MKNIWKIIKISRPLHKWMLLSSLLVTIQAGLSLVAPLIIKQMVDQLVAVQTGQGQLSMSDLWYWISILLGLSLLTNLLGVASGRLGDFISGRLRNLLTNRFYQHVLRLPLSYFDSELSGKITSQLNRGISGIEGFVNTLNNFILTMMLQTVFSIILLARYSWWVALLVGLMFPIYGYLTYLSTIKWDKIQRQRNRISDRLYGRIHECLLNIRLVKSYLAERKEAVYVQKMLGKRLALYDQQSNMFYRYQLARDVLVTLITIAISGIVFYRAWQGVLTIGSVVLIIQLLNMARVPLFSMSFILSRTQQAETDSADYFKILSLDKLEPLPQSKIKRLDQAVIKFDRVSFAYQSDEQVLHDVSFEIGPHQSVALVGHSGAGKSTIVNLILKFYQPQSGEIYLNRKPYSNLETAFIRSQISFVMQNSEIFSATVAENVAYGKRVNKQDIIKALKQAYAWEFVQQLPRGINTYVGERGIRLSGGQKQRIQLARAFLHNSPILILDEATSSLDSQSEQLVYKALKKLMQNRLTIIIAHRFSTIQDVDHILVLEKGRLVDQGSPGQLARRPGIYQDLLKYQLEGNQKLLAGYELVG